LVLLLPGMMEINPVYVAGSSGITTTRRRGPFAVSTLWAKKDLIPQFQEPSYDHLAYNIQVKEEAAYLENLRDSTMRIGLIQLDMDSNSRAGGFSSLSSRITYESIPDGYLTKSFTREPFHYNLTESDEYHKPWAGVGVHLICEANWVTVTTVTTYTPGLDPVVVTTETSLTNDLTFNRSFVAGDWVYDPLAPSQTYYKQGTAIYDGTNWIITNPDLVSAEFQYYEQTYTIVYDPLGTGAYVETNIQSNLVTVINNPLYATQPWVLDFCTNPGFWFG
jgi:hypothetical protein